MSFATLEGIVWGCGVYSIECAASNHFYLGSSIRVMKRLAEHESLLVVGKHYNRGLQAAYDSGQPLSVTMIGCSNRDEAYDLEQKLIDLCHGGNYCLNVATVARGLSGTRRVIKHTPETKRRMSETKKAKSLREQKVRELINENRRLAGLNLRAMRRLEKSQKQRAKKESRYSKPVMIKGVYYPNVPRASEALGLTTGAIYSRLKSRSWPQFAYAPNTIS